MQDDVRRFTRSEMLRLAARAVHKIDLLGPRGTTLCTMEEIEAMAALLVASDALPRPAELHEGGDGAPSTSPPTPLSTGDGHV